MRMSPWAVTALAVALPLAGCGGRIGYRWSYRNAGDTGPYGGPYVTLAASTADGADPLGNAPYVQFLADYNFAAGDDCATAGGGLAVAPSAGGYHTSTLLLVSFEPWHRMGLHVSLCETWGNWGELGACARWSSKGYLGVDALGGINVTRLAADAHEWERLHPGEGSGWSHDFD